MTTGSCFCGNSAYEFTGEAVAKALCHCRDCQKISGSTYSTNIIVPGEGFKVTKGSPKVYTKVADSGNQVHSHFCPDCGTTLFRKSNTFGTAVLVKVGGLDDPSSFVTAKPALELFAPDRVSWVAAVGGADQKKAMPDSASV